MAVEDWANDVESTRLDHLSISLEPSDILMNGVETPYVTIWLRHGDSPFLKSVRRAVALSEFESLVGTKSRPLKTIMDQLQSMLSAILSAKR